MAIVLFCGFEKIELLCEFFRSSNLKKGIKLYDSNHVYAVREVQDHINIGPVVTGKCVAQTGKQAYDVVIELQQQRKISRASCTCRGGILGRCKHVAAVAAFINKSAVNSCTSFPQSWGVPTSKPQLDDKKSIDDLFGGEGKNATAAKRIVPVLLSDLLPKFQGIRSVVTKAIELEFADEVERACRITLQSLIEAAASKVEKEDIHAALQASAHERSVFQCMNVVQASPTLRRHVSHCNVEEVARATLGQNVNDRWHKERRLRVTASNAHRVWTRKDGFEKLAKSLVCPRRVQTAAMAYGTATETAARQSLQREMKVPVTQIGLVVHDQQPWLCGSPDGLMKIREEQVLVEIKCPHSRRGKPVVDRAQKLSYVKYLTYDHDEGQFYLKETHSYYTQVQVMMYILNITKTLFYVYSSSQQVTVNVARNDAFLSQLVPKLEHFYFVHLLNEFC
ncbi:uncharacterized protein LOC135366038 [Ornithodoros turicata]